LGQKKDARTTGNAWNVAVAEGFGVVRPLSLRERVRVRG
jgi:hypothetical protein